MVFPSTKKKKDLELSNVSHWEVRKKKIKDLKKRASRDTRLW